MNEIITSNVPVVAAFILGIMLTVSPCPLATNIAAIGYLSKDIDNRRRIFFNGLLYTLGRVIAYTALAFMLIPILREGASAFKIQKYFGKYGEVVVGFILLIIGIGLLFGDKIKIPKIGFAGVGEKLKKYGSWGALLLGILFAMAFCPTSGLLYFGGLIPLSAASRGGYWLPIVFAIASSLPVIVVAWILAFSVAGIGNFYHKIQAIQKWANRVIAVLFVILGLYYIITFYI